MKARHDAMDKGCKSRPEQPEGKPQCKHHMLKIAFANLGGVFLKQPLETHHDIVAPGTPFDLNIMAWAPQNFLPFFNYFCCFIGMLSHKMEADEHG